MSTSATRSATAPDVALSAKHLAARIVACREDAERLRRTPADLSGELAEAGFYKMFMPRSLGGLELPPLTAFEAVEELSRADGSVGWCVMIGADVSLFTGWLEPDAARKMFGQPPDARVFGSLRPQGRAYAVEGGYRVKGQWNFASGIDNANWLYAPCIVFDGEKPRMAPSGVPVVRAMWLPAAEISIVDTWSTLGMRGTGSQDFVVDDRFVPNERTCFIGDAPFEKGPLYQQRGMLTIVWAVTAAVSLGIARGAIEEFLGVAGREASTQSTTILRERPAVQARVGQAEAVLNSARAYVVDAVGRAWEVLAAREKDPSRQLMHARLAIVHSIHEAVRVVDLVFHAAGTNAIFTRNPLERHFRDIHVAVQHNSAFEAQYESAGKILMGLRPSDPGW